MDRPIPILVNARAGAYQSTAGADQLRRMAEQVGVNAEVIPVGSPARMRETVRRLVHEEVDRVAVAGGDGTIRLVVQELAHTNTALGILQQGTFNNFATALRLPQDLPTALRILRDGSRCAVSLGRAANEYFIEAAGVGLFAEGIARYGNETNKNILRGAAAILRLAVGFRPRSIRLTLDGRKLEERAVMVTVANTYRMAQAVPIAPGATLTDDHFDVVVIGDLRRGELLPYYRAIRAQTHYDLPKVRILQARDILLESRRPLHVHADDLHVGTTPVEITLHPRALNVLVDRP